MAEEDPRRSLLDALGKVGNLGELWGTRREGDVDGNMGSMGRGDLKLMPGGVDRNDDDDEIDGLSEATDAVFLDAWVRWFWIRYRS